MEKIYMCIDIHVDIFNLNFCFDIELITSVHVHGTMNVLVLTVSTSTNYYVHLRISYIWYKSSVLSGEMGNSSNRYIVNVSFIIKYITYFIEHSDSESCGSFITVPTSFDLYFSKLCLSMVTCSRINMITSLI